jgi:hypothetical protein
VCEQGVCLASAAEGEACRSDGHCNADSNATLNGAPRSLVCGASMRCVFEGDESSPCTETADCDSSLACIEGVCVERLKDGAACQDDEVCASSFCHPLAGTCGRSTKGGPCQDSEQCAPGSELACIEQVCGEPQPIGAACNNDDQCIGRCHDGSCVGAAGDLCGEAGPCDGNLVCTEAVDGERRCVRNAAFQCDESTSCAGDACQTECAKCDLVHVADVSDGLGGVKPVYAAGCIPF